MSSQGRNLVLCFDGTTNKFGTDRITNVVRMFELLEKTSPEQFCYYQPGIGTYDAKIPVQDDNMTVFSKFTMLVDAAFANSLWKQISGGYRFLMTHYHSNDRIYMFGFSRGAYTVRALCGMLEKVGLLSFGNDEQIRFAWKMYEQEGNKNLADTFRRVFCQDVQIHFLGLWDTVKATRRNLYEPQTKSFISYVYHALALDERRVDFKPHPYLEPKEDSRQPSGQPDTRVFERWFVGDHSDIGGRFPFTGLSGDALANPPFRWIVWAASRAAGNRHLLFNTLAFGRYCDIIVYNKDQDIEVGYLNANVPEADSESAQSDRGGRPQAELQNFNQDVNNNLKALSPWRVKQLLRLKNSTGNARIINDDTILHSSVRGKIAIDGSYPGKQKRRDTLMRATDNEHIH